MSPVPLLTSCRVLPVFLALAAVAALGSCSSVSKGPGGQFTKVKTYHLIPGLIPRAVDPSWRGPDPALRTAQAGDLGAGLGPELEPLARGACRRLVLEGSFGVLELSLDARTRRFEGQLARSIFDLAVDWRSGER